MKKLKKAKKEQYQFFLDIDYVDGKGESSYKSVDLHVSDLSGKVKDKTVKFNSGEPAVDYIDAMKEIAKYPSTRTVSKSMSSSVHNFVSDSIGLKWVEFITNFKQIAPKYVNSLEELQEYYKIHKSK